MCFGGRQQRKKKHLLLDVFDGIVISFGVCLYIQSFLSVQDPPFLEIGKHGDAAG